MMSQAHDNKYVTGFGENPGMKKSKMILGRAITAALLLTVSAVAVAQAFPSRPIRLVVPAAPGGGTDILARLLSPELTKQFGQQIVIENRAGGATMIGTEFVARSAPDGHTMVIATTPHAINPTLYKKVPFDPVKDFTMISQLGLTTTVLVVHPSLPDNNVKEFIALARARRVESQNIRWLSARPCAPSAPKPAAQTRSRSSKSR